MKKLFMFVMVLTVIFIAFFACNTNQSEYTVSFDADGGYFPDNNPFVFEIVEIVEINVEAGKTIDDLPSPSSRMFESPEYFDGWYTKKNGAGMEFTTTTKVVSDLTVYAKWTYPELEYNFDEETFLSEWNLWNNQNIQNYSFTLLDGMRGNVDYLLKNGIVSEIDLPNSRSISGPPPPDFIEKWEIIVKDGIMDSFEYTYLSPIIVGYNSFIGYGPSNPGSIRTPQYMSISDMYQKISQSTLFNIGYDLDFHYIKFLHRISWMCGSECEGYCNGNTTSIVSDFKILEQ